MQIVNAYFQPVILTLKDHTRSYICQVKCVSTSLPLPLDYFYSFLQPATLEFSNLKILFSIFSEHLKRSLPARSEISNFLSRFTSVLIDAQILVCYIGVTKRVSTGFFLRRRSHASESFYPPADS